jgi:DNA repair exonuclease SbcCD nuclease subunit
MSTLTFLHAADIHLDSPLRRLQQYDDATATRLRAATRVALANLVDLAIAENVAFVVIAGDLYDGDWDDVRTGLYFVQQMRRLKDAEIAVFAIAGNHDAATKMTYNVPLPDNVTVFGHRVAETVRLDDIGVAIHGRSFATQSVTENLAVSYPTAIPDLFNIGILHTSLAPFRISGTRVSTTGLSGMSTRERSSIQTRGLCIPATLRAAAFARPTNEERCS